MTKLITAIVFIALTTTALAETAQLGENQNPPKKSEASGCKYARKAKELEAKSASKTEAKKATTMKVE